MRLNGGGGGDRKGKGNIPVKRDDGVRGQTAWVKKEWNGMKTEGRRESIELGLARRVTN